MGTFWAMSLSFLKSSVKSKCKLLAGSSVICVRGVLSTKSSPVPHGSHVSVWRVLPARSNQVSSCKWYGVKLYRFILLHNGKRILSKKRYTKDKILVENIRFIFKKFNSILMIFREYPFRIVGLMKITMKKVSYTYLMLMQLVLNKIQW